MQWFIFPSKNPFNFSISIVKCVNYSGLDFENLRLIIRIIFHCPIEEKVSLLWLCYNELKEKKMVDIKPVGITYKINWGHEIKDQSKILRGQNILESNFQLVQGLISKHIKICTKEILPRSVDKQKKKPQKEFRKPLPFVPKNRHTFWDLKIFLTPVIIQENRIIEYQKLCLFRESNSAHAACTKQNVRKFRKDITYLHDKHGSYGFWMSPMNDKEHDCCQRNTMNQVRYIARLYPIIDIK